MPSSTDARNANIGLDLSGKTAAVSSSLSTHSLCGSSTAQGIGAAVGIRFAQAGANVYIIGRNEQLGQEVVEKCRQQAKDAADGRTYEFIKADLSCVRSLFRSPPS